MATLYHRNEFFIAGNMPFASKYLIMHRLQITRISITAHLVFENMEQNIKSGREKEKEINVKFSRLCLNKFHLDNFELCVLITMMNIFEIKKE